jgi:hypothetical protein
VTNESNTSEVPEVSVTSSGKEDETAPEKVKALLEQSPSLEQVLQNFVVEFQSMQADEEAESAGANESSEQYAWIRDTAIRLAGVSAMLYLASHIYGHSYLNQFGVRGGFQNIGISNLSMLGPLDCGYIIGFGSVVHWAINQQQVRRFIPSLAVALMINILFLIRLFNWLIRVSGGWQDRDSGRRSGIG